MKTILSPRKLSVLAMALSLSSVWACSNAGKGDEGSGSAQNLGPSQGADQTKPSRILITPKPQWSDLSGYIVGRADSSRVVAIADQPGKQGFPNLSEGSYEIILFANAKDNDGRVSPVGLRISGLRLGESEDAQIRDIDLRPLLTLQGKAILDTEPGADLSSIRVTIPGTALSASVAADGSYSLVDVPEGNHEVNFEAAGFAKGFISTKSYRANDRLPPISLAPQATKLETGVHYLGATLAKGSAARIALQLKAPQGMNGFRYALAGEALDSRPWLPLQSSLEIDLPAGDKPEVQVQFSLDQSQLSSVYSVTIPVE